MYNTIQSTIVSQVGAAFVNAHAFRQVVSAAHYEGENTVTFLCPKLRRAIKVVYNEGRDEYDVEVTQYTKNYPEKTVNTFKGVFCDQLGEYFLNQ